METLFYRNLFGNFCVKDDVIFPKIQEIGEREIVLSAKKKLV